MRAIDALADAMSMDLAVEDESLYVRTALKTLSARGFAVVPVVAPDCIRNINGSANWSKMIDAIAAAQEDGR
jgi:phosphoserine aminotransferase